MGWGIFKISFDKLGLRLKILLAEEGILSKKRRRKKGKKKKKILTDEEIKRVYNILYARINKVILRFLNKHWIEDFNFTTPFLDSRGVDVECWFKPFGNGKAGCLFVQQKTQKKDVARHFQKYPMIPVYLLSIKDDELQIEYVFLTLFLECRSYNFNKEIEIQRRHRALRKMLQGRKTKKPWANKRVWLNWKNRYNKK